MTDRPILFSGPMVRAILDGRKTQDRRVAKITAIMGNKVAITNPDERLIELEPGEFRTGIFHYESIGALSGPYRTGYAVGDRLWVRERFMPAPDEPAPATPKPTRWNIAYAAGGQEFAMAPADYNPMLYNYERWSPSVFMPRWASRLTLLVTDVRVQRLHEISNREALAEGIAPMPSGRFHCGHDEEGEVTAKSPVTAYAWLWNSLNGWRGFGWEANPWVVAITFDVRRCNIDQMDEAA